MVAILECNKNGGIIVGDINKIIIALMSLKGVRPENILPVEEDGAVSAKVDDVELIGRERILKFTHDGVQARSLVNLETPIKPGDNINLKMRLDRVFLFTKEGERVY